MKFNADVLILPGLGNSGENHWQTIWENEFGFTRLTQSEWETPDKTVWIDRIQEFVTDRKPASVILVGHSLACSAIVFWCQKYMVKIKGALLVAPSDTESEIYPRGTTGFSPMPKGRLIFPSIVVSSTNDVYVSVSRAKEFSTAWGSELVLLNNAGHINVAAGFGAWPGGLDLLKKLDY